VCVCVYVCVRVCMRVYTYEYDPNLFKFNVSIHHIVCVRVCVRVCVCVFVYTCTFGEHGLVPSDLFSLTDLQI